MITSACQTSQLASVSGLIGIQAKRAQFLGELTCALGFCLGSLLCRLGSLLCGLSASGFSLGSLLCFPSSLSFSLRLPSFRFSPLGFDFGLSKT